MRRKMFDFFPKKKKNKNQTRKNVHRTEKKASYKHQQATISQNLYNPITII